MNDNQMTTGMPVNVFAAKLTDYIIDRHPQRIDDTEFINARGLYAAEVFEQCSRAGMNVGESLYEAERSLFQGLHFSPFLTIVDILTEEFDYDERDDELYAFAIQMLAWTDKVFKKYKTGDDFEGTYEYVSLCSELTESINRYINDNGL